MSDGERVVVYLLGQALCAPANAVLIIHEPEIHVHRAVQASLWDELERARPDCAFVYITHDLEFASTRMGARKTWVRSYDGAAWEWEDVPPAGEIPESLLLAVLGSRRPVLFVEGERSSRDYALYSVLFPGELVLPRQGCDAVVHATRSIRALEGDGVHHVQARGIGDRDRRSDAEIGALRASGIVVADVAEVENLFACRRPLVPPRHS
jgi:hypothetical protein